MKYHRLCVLFSASVLLSGCASLGKGVAEAYFEKQEQVDTRQCEVRGSSFVGLNAYFDSKSKIKVLMTHGVGDHTPGYATQFSEKLAQALNLTVMSNRYKNISLTDSANKNKRLGNLRISRFLDQSKTKELLFYELTWSEITAKQKEVLAYDNSGAYSFRRAEVNNLLKKFSNDTGPDPIIYLGESRNDILTAFTQSFCWMSQGGWQELPEQGSFSCQLDDLAASKIVTDDNYAFVSHSLGSRITIDGFQKIADSIAHSTQQQSAQKKLVAALQNKKITLYMMSNQLPMLQLGRGLPVIYGQANDYCQANGAHYADRMLAKTSVIAFSDPNDILSYAIQPGFVEKYLDSRLCLDVTNININIATVFDGFGLGSMANPLEAHIGYDTDDRVVALIAKGIGNAETAEIVKQRCRWIETIE